MKKIFILLLLAIILNAFEISDFYSVKKVGELKYVLKEIKDGSIIKSENFIVKVSKIDENRLLQFFKNDKLDLEIFLDINDKPIQGYTYIKDRKVEIREDRLYKKRNESNLSLKKEENIRLKNKNYNVTKSVYMDDSTHSIINGNLILKTLVETKTEIFKDENGIPIKIETVKNITQRTYNLMKPDKIIQETKKNLKEIIELES